jgi:TRAP-type mannitol/chloroaromatic compound transport system permease large subunit
MHERKKITNSNFFKMKLKFLKVIPVFAILVLVFFNVFVTINNETGSATLGSIKALAIDEMESLPPGPIWRYCKVGTRNSSFPPVLYCGDCNLRWVNPRGDGFCQ